MTNQDNNLFNAADYLIYQSNIQQSKQDKTAFYYKDKAYTYKQLFNLVKQYGQMLSNRGIKKGQPIGIILNDCPELIYSFWGAMIRGIVPILINPKFSLKEIDYIIKNSNIKLLITHQNNKEELSKLKDSVDQIYIEYLEIKELEELNPRRLQSTTSKEDLAFGICTSGSSGLTKIVMHQHIGLKECTQYYAQGTLGLKEDDIIYSVSKMSHSYGLGNSTFNTFSVGASSIVSSAENLSEIINNINKYQPTVFLAVPAIYDALLRISEIKKVNFQSVRLFVSAGERLLDQLWQRWYKKFGMGIIDGLGTTETLTTFISNTPETKKIGSTGKVVQGFNVKIVDEFNQEVPCGEIGNLLVAGDTVTPGYLKDNQLCKDHFYKGYLKTGDRFREDQDGFLWYEGRSKDTFKVNGRWVNAQQVEQTLLSSPWVKEAFVIEGKSDYEVSCVVAYLVLDEEVEASKEITIKIKSFLKQRLEHFKAPKIFHYISQIPRGATNKIKRVHLDDKYINLTVKGG
ncbi:benzoate-CoA ligase [Orenia metallireducens]|uniref:Benzoate-CoA ligase n=1 Tax=Orenia metallireducens TaxID=1413210 RepID=A0A285I5X0_9FIRM|nr:AMP-binding protein [Orenia metallireducens]PRX23126.1 benzoate-CoA ligase [Orenia metallireducens]SNY42466.1 benzoate-CoA ligase [Orenia metallireducens]